ncbi:MAG: GTPase ObgE [Dehalococcoidia bacterium]|nr:GTPase ObgE [Dehalococcoidia bacterium]
MLIDKVEIYVRAGDGGNGMIGFRREKYVPYGGPDGGDGGHGGNISVVADRGMNTLLKYYQGKRRFAAERGENGSGRKKHGKNGSDLDIKVPQGTLIYKEREGERELMVDMAVDGQRVMVARGGRGGYGNTRFATPVNQAPRIAQKGEVGDEASLILELKLIADVGIIGHPSVGKSTLLAAASAARPKIAAYPFTTTEPILGVVDVGHNSFVLAEIPGLIEGAHRGLGLGHDFLRHAERTRVLIHLLDGGSANPRADMDQINKELAMFNPVLASKMQLVAVNKIDLPEVLERIPELQKELGNGEAPFFISAATTEGVSQLMTKASEMLDSIDAPQPVEAITVFRPQPRKERVTVSMEGEIFIVSSSRAEKLIARMDVQNPEARAYIRNQFTRIGVAKALRNAGVKPGDMVRFGKVEMKWE